MTLVERLAAHFRQHQGEWIDGRVLAGIAGFYAFRTRVSDLRRAPFFMRIDNRQRRVTRDAGETFVVSEYIYLGERRTSAADDAETSPAAAQN